jgi:hypothetical protein
MTWIHDGDDHPEFVIGQAPFGPRLTGVGLFVAPPATGQVSLASAQRARLEATGSSRGFGAPWRFEQPDDVHARVDLDGDGAGDLIGNSAGSNFEFSCVGYRLGLESRPASQWDWLFHRGDPAEPSASCNFVDLDDDGQIDVVARFHDPAVAGGVRFYVDLGPFPLGEHDVAASPVLEGTRLGTNFWFFVGDFNGDGLRDFGLSAVADAPGQADPQVELFFAPFASTALDQPDVVIRGSSSQLSLNVAFSPGDIDGDGSDDLVVDSSSHSAFDSGAVFVFKGPFVAGAYDDIDADTTIRWPQPGSRTGIRVNSAGDVDGDGRADFAVGAFPDLDAPMPYDATPYWPAPDTADTGVAAPTGFEGAFMVFGDPPAGVVGPEEAKFTLLGAPGELISWGGITPAGDLDGDGADDLSYIAYGNDTELRIVHPCADFGVPVAP